MADTVGPIDPVSAALASAATFRYSTHPTSVVLACIMENSGCSLDEAWAALLLTNDASDDEIAMLLRGMR